MVAQNYAGAVRAGAMAAARIHRDMTLKETIEARGGNVDVFKAIHQLDVPLLLRPLKGLLGAFLNEPSPGILVTTERPMSIQRFTAAHELGHYVMRHEPSLDDESMLRRMPINAQPASDLQEVEADAFATAFMLPVWLLGWHMMRQGWTVAPKQFAPRGNTAGLDGAQREPPEGYSREIRRYVVEAGRHHQASG